MTEMRTTRQQSENDSTADEEKVSLYKEDESEPDVETKQRGQWKGKFEFLLAIIGYTVGIGSIWRFPILCAKNGGGAFMIPFTFFMLTCGGPLYYLEVCLGQFSGKSAVAAFELCPIFKGLGFLMATISLLVTWYIVAVLMWILYYLYSSFSPVLPWSTCDNWWNTKLCSDHFSTLANQAATSLNVTMMTTMQNVTVQSTTVVPSSNGSSSSPAYEFWVHNVLRKSESLENFGQIQIHLVVCLFVAWVLLVLAVIKGVDTLGKVVYVTATMPYVFLTIILVRGLTLEGSLDGVLYFVRPDFQKLAQYEVWLEAAVQVFYSLGPTWGGVITMASYNNFHKKNFSPTVLCVASDIFTAFYSGLVVFSVIGFMAHEMNISVDELAKESGPGLAFIAYPTAITRMPFPQLWAVLFFIMMVFIAFDSDFGMLETVTNGVIDLYPQQLVRWRPLVNCIAGLFFFLTGLSFTCNGSLYLFQLVDWYSSAFALILGSALEGIVVCWVYGADRFSRDIAMMTGRKVSVFLRILWVIVMPSFMLIAFLILLTGYSQPDYGDGYVYQPYAIALGFVMGLLPIMALIAGGTWQIIKTRGPLLKRLQTTLQPGPTWGPCDQKNLEMYRMKPYVYPRSFLRRVWLNLRGPEGTPWF